MLQSKPAAPQSEAMRQSTQARVAGLHTRPAHPAESDGSQAPQAPDIAPLSAHCCPGQSASSSQASQVEPLHTGVRPEHAGVHPGLALHVPSPRQVEPAAIAWHSVLLVQRTQVAVVLAQTGVPAGHTPVAAGSHAPQAPSSAPLVTHTPVAHSLVAMQPRQVPASHSGVVPPQSPSSLHSMHLLVATSHTASIAAHTDWSSPSHATQAPMLAPAVAQIGVPVRAAQSPSLAQAAHAIAPPAPARQTGVAPLHPASSSGSHGAQLPSAEQKSRSTSVMHSAASVQPRQAVDSSSQIGVVRVVQSELSLQPPHTPVAVHSRGAGQLSGAMVHPSQVLVAGLQIGVGPLHPELSLGSHWTQLPPTHCSPPQSVASRHSTHAPASSSQSGVAPLHAAPSPQRHSRSTHALLASASQAVPHALHCAAPTAMQRGEPP
jgi:hypothetical protein